MASILEKIIRAKKMEIPALKKSFTYLGKKDTDNNMPKFKKAFYKKAKVKIIPEIKPASPSVGQIFNPTPQKIKEIARIYDSFPIGAISILTDHKFFNGAYENIALVREITDKPILCKEFIIDEIQIRIAKYFGADAILLIADVLPFSRLLDLYHFAKVIKLDVLFECHNKKNLELLLKNNIDIIGINNRNLSTLKVDIRKSVKIRSLIPDNKICIAESGFEKKQNIKELAKYNFHGVLVGTSILQSDDMENKLGELVFYDK